MGNTTLKNEEEHKYTGYYSAQLVKTPHLAHVLAYWCGGLFMILNICLFLPWTQNISSIGSITSFDPEDRPQTVNATIAGRIEKWHVREGQFVKKGDTIISLSEVKEKYFDPNILLRINEQVQAKERSLQSTKDKASSLTKQIQAMQQNLRFSLNKARNKVQQVRLKVQSDSMDMIASRTDYQVAEAQYRRQEKLYEKGLKSLTELESRRLKLQESQAKLLSSENKYNAAKTELINARIELNSLEAEYLDKIAKAESELNSTLSYFYNIESEISKMNNEYTSTQIRSSFYQITAPQDGYVVKALHAGLGETIKEGEAVVTVMPANPKLAVELYVKPMDVPLIHKGHKVRIQFDGWPMLAFSGWPGLSVGTFGGVVAVVDNIDSKGSYRVLVVPDPTDEPWPKPLRVGSGVNGWALLNDVPIWYEIWRQLNGFPPDYVSHNYEREYDTNKMLEKKEGKTEKTDAEK